MPARTVRRRALLCSALVSLACSAATRTPAGAQVGPLNTLTQAEAADGWRLLFDGHSTAGWRGYRLDSMPSGWRVVDGALTRVAPAGDIISRDQFTDFDLRLEWKVSPKGNSGIFYRATEDAEWIYQTAPEMQVLDDAGHADGANRLTAAGSDYGLYPAPAGIVRPAGEWNAVRIVVQGRHVTHWLNGTKVVDYRLLSPDWAARVAASKFKEWPGYGRAPRGHIGLQDHGDWVAYRNIKLRELP